MITSAFRILVSYLKGIPIPYRVLPGGASSSRVYLVDGGGNGDHQTIQAALNAAHAQNPTSTSRWLVLVGPGSYTESLTLYDFVDLSGLAPGPSAILNAPLAQPAIATVASCWPSNLRISGSPDTLLNFNTAGTEIVLDTVTINESTPTLVALKVNTGSVILRGCDISSGGEAVQIGGGTLKAYHTRLAHYHTDAGAVTEHAVLIDGGTLLLDRCIVENLSPAGAGIHLTANPTSAKILHCTVRKSSASNLVTADIACANAIVAACLVNAAVHSNIGISTGNDIVTSI